MRKRIHALADLLLRWLSGNGAKSYSLAGIRFLAAADVKRIFPECIINEGRAEVHSVPAQVLGKTAFLLEGAGRPPEELFRSYEVRLDAPFSARFQAGSKRKLFAASGCLLVRDEKLGAFFISPEPTASKRVASGFRRTGTDSAASFLAVSSWKSFTFGDFALIMLPKLARVAGRAPQGLLMLPDLTYITQYLRLLGLELMTPQTGSKLLIPIRDFAEVAFGPGVESGFVSLRSDIELLRDRIYPLLPKKNLPSKIYLCRAGRRKILNEEKLLPLLKQLGFEVIDDNHTDVLEQAALFRAADFIVCPHGSILANLVYCKPGTVLVELLPGSYAAICYRTLSQLAGVRYHAVFCTKLGRFLPEAVAEDFPADPMKLSETIKAIWNAAVEPAH